MTRSVTLRTSAEVGSPLITVHAGPQLLSGVADGPGIEAHRNRFGMLPGPSLPQLVDRLRAADVRGRGGAGFPFATKLEAAAGAKGRAVVVINVSEGEPASFKDAALALTAPHLVLDGAVVTAHALRTKHVHVIVPSEHHAVEQSIRRALVERGREDGRIRWTLHYAEPRFVAGQARAVIELMSGRDNLPVTAWQPEALDGYKGRPTLLSNAETFAHVAALALDGRGLATPAVLGDPAEPGTTLLTIAGDTGRPQVVEVPYGTPWREVLPADMLRGPVLLGGYHGTWAAPGALGAMTVSRTGMAEHGLALGAGVVLPLDEQDCPVSATARITGYLASQSAGRCGPCLNGLPALAAAVAVLDSGSPSTERVEHLSRMVARRGACAHPDGTVRLVASMLAAFADEIDAHAAGRCSYGPDRSQHERSGLRVAG